MEHFRQNLTCKLTTAELRNRRATVITELKHLIAAREDITNGYKYIFPGDDATLDKILGFIKSERLCCDFFSFTLSIDSNKAMLDISGPTGSKEFLDHEVGF